LWWVESLAAYKEAGIEVDYVSIQNEPDYLASWDSCQLEPTETAGIAGYDAAFEAVWQKLNSEMGSDMPKMIGPESSGLGRAGEYIDELEDKSHIYGYSHHLYNCSGDGDNIPGCGADPDRYISDMDFFKMEYGGKPLMQTEFEHEPGTLEDAINTAITLHNSLTVEGVTAYLYWELFWGPGTGMVSLNDPDTYSITPTYYAFKNYSAFVDSGWQRVDASTDSSYLKVSAYISPDGDKMSVVIINTAKSEISLETSFKGFSVSKGEVYRTSETEECDNVGGYDKVKPLKLPAKSITTLTLSGS
jgi:O-glycosyl hydrolase